MSKQFTIAMQLANEYHAGQKYGDKEYMYHLLGVLNLVEQAGGGDMERCVALLHDILEDTECTPHKLRTAGLCEEIVEGVMAITRYEMQDQRTYLKQCWANRLSRFVKRWDSMFNLIHSLREGNSKRIQKYTKVIQFLDEYKSKKGAKSAEKSS